jgi:hypothetical protein
MLRNVVGSTVLAGCALAVLALGARAGDAPCAPAFRTVCVTEWVPQQYVATRVCYHSECAQEKYTAFRAECVPETRTVTSTVYKQVPEVREEVRTVCVPVTTIETHTCMKPVITCKPVTTVCRKCVDMGHYECCEVPCRESCLTRLRRHLHHECEPCPPPTKTVQVWVPCKVWVETPVTTMVRSCEWVPTPVQVPVCKLVPHQETVKVCSYRCVAVPQTQTVTVMVSRCVPYEATRTVVRCVPAEEKVTLCRMVPHVVQKQVPIVPCCCTPCCH